MGHSRSSLRTAKSPWGLTPEQGLWQKPWRPLQLKHFWPGSGYAVMKRFQCPQGENDQKKGEKRKGWSCMK